MFVIVFQVFSCFFHVFRAHVLNVSAVSYICCNCFYLDVFKSRSGVLCMLQYEPLVAAACCSC
jgi:hypothetical protein